MTTIYKFAKLLDDDNDNKYVLGYVGPAAKEYVALADYESQAAEIARLRQQNEALTRLYNACRAKGNMLQIEVFEELMIVQEALK